ncbi:uncharacterized protein HMPREF1541_05970 [Cyphellophora europaea CBS 101466]|uniref:Enoyl reductase (ER) domain-containing protein n=1 Tax=Cyphellophora europaea (strain CBS 101466) TaxID=1220924 RepID=W2RVL5_CYPE1|nr:uncharacterized protein HMPREF1541_05970 [Cyphellophora europaea CBS 101466]ETN39744.1 hypothetical protein HMPREF1541_05970 [Cyphellophora europaea CBS 101466]
MRAWHLTAFNTPYTLTPSQPTPHPILPHDILIRVLACSYCHTDALVAAGAVPPQPALPHIGCHEFVGRVVAFFRDPDNPADAAVAPAEETRDGLQLQLQLGDTVAVPGRGNHVCGACLECRADSAVSPDPAGFSVYCPASGAGLGVDRPGGFAEYAVVDARQVARVPEVLAPCEVAPLMCAGLTIFVALRKLGLRKGDRVGVVGCGGGLGHLGLQFAVKMGLRVHGFDMGKRALGLARGLGTGAEVVDVRERGAEGVRREIGREDGRVFFEEMGLDAVVLLAESQEAWDYAVGLVRNGGKMMVLSFPPAGFRLNPFDLVIRRVSVEGSLIGSNRAMAEMFAFCVEHGVRAKIKRYPFEKLNELVEDYHQGEPGKLVLDMETST